MEFSLNDACPQCGKSLPMNLFRKAKLQWKAKLMVAVASMFLCVTMMVLPFLKIDIGLWLLAAFLSLALLWVGLSLPRVLVIRCKSCGWHEKRLRRQAKSTGGAIGKTFIDFLLAQWFIDRTSNRKTLNEMRERQARFAAADASARSSESQETEQSPKEEDAPPNNGT